MLLATFLCCNAAAQLPPQLQAALLYSYCDGENI